MDPLSLIIDDMRFDGVVFEAAERVAPWSLHLKTPGQASFHVITEGQAWLQREGLAPVLLQTGDLVVLPAGEDHWLQHHDQTGSDGMRTAMVSGHARFDLSLIHI